MSNEKLYPIKEIVMMETSIADFHHTFLHTRNTKESSITATFPFLGTRHCGKTSREAFKYRSALQDVLCYCDYS